LVHISYEAGILEDPYNTPPADMWKWTASAESAPTTPDHITIEFKQGKPVKLTVLTDNNKTYTDSVEVYVALNELGSKHGCGRGDAVENRFIGVKSRGCYESPGAAILRVAHIDIEGLTLDKKVRALRDQFVSIELTRILYNGHYFTPEREFVTAAIPTSQRTVNGIVKLKLFKGNVIVEGRSSDEVRVYLG
jgi:argininosuccinate synthase